VKHRLLNIPIAFLFLLSFIDCAKKGSPTGGDKDSIPPVIVRSVPENYSINFKENEIEIYFDEYIKLKEIQKNLIVSPPLKYPPIISPLNTSKVLKIKILDTLRENTTYSFNFGNSIVDNNEGNPFEYYKYVFSTGTYIDSLKLSGEIRDIQLLKPESPATVLLYEVNEDYKDSLVFSEKPNYITVTTDTSSTFEFTNLKEGTYLLLALKDKANNYTFQPKNDKIGFADDFITLPTDSTYTITLFSEIPEYTIAKPKQKGKNQITFGYEGVIDSLELQLISEAPTSFEYKIYRDIKSDSLRYWYKPVLEKNSAIFIAKNRTKIDTLTTRLKKLYGDSLKISDLNSSKVTILDTLKLQANTPLIAIDTTKINVINKDSVAVAATGRINSKYNIAEIIFNKNEDQTYNVQLLPGTFTDFFENTNDTIDFRVRTKPNAEYGTLNLTLQNLKTLPVIVQLVDSKFNVVFEKYRTENIPVFFSTIFPGDYYIRIIYDENKNRKWDTGNFLERKQPERIIYYPSKIEVRSNWSLNETFILE